MFFYFMQFVSLLNVAWFGAAVNLFLFNSRSALSLLVNKRENRKEPFSSIISKGIQFIGAFNLSYLMLAITCFYKGSDLIANEMTIYIFTSISLAHFGQFGVNFPIAWIESTGQVPLWTVLTRSMWFIFRVDFLMGFLNGIIVFLLFLNQ